AVTLTMPDGPVYVSTDEGWNWVEGPDDVWTMALVDGADNYGTLTFDASDPDAVKVSLDIPDGVTIYDPMNDGDVASIVFGYSAIVEGSEDATVTINVNGTNDGPVAGDDIVITNVLGDIFVPEYAMLANDTDIDDDDDVLFIESVSQVDNEVELGVDYVRYDVTGDGSYEYDVSDGSATDTAEVSVSYTEGRELNYLKVLDEDENEVDAGYNEIFIGGEEADTIDGGGGDDTIIGGGGNDLINIEEGADTLHYMDVGDGEDNIFGFDEAEDVINLDALFDELGVGTPDERAAMINLDVSGGDTVITIDGQDDFSITLKNVNDLGTHDGLTAAEAALKGIVVSDES
ncbi:MAG: hypothetical protein JKX94_05540, partial [Sneathiella sp.]|nr:hypothetical protein [Sneathiella sp.]